MILYWRFKHEIVEFEEKADKENVTPADYAVEVTGIPMDARDEVRPARLRFFQRILLSVSSKIGLTKTNSSDSFRNFWKTEGTS